MDEEIKTLMDEKIKSQIQDLNSLAPGSEEQTAAVKNLTALYEARINDEKLNAEKKEHTIDRLVRILTVAAEIGLPLVCYGHWFNTGLKFEETGCISSSMVRNLLTKLKPKK